MTALATTAPPAEHREDSDTVAAEYSLAPTEKPPAPLVQPCASCPFTRGDGTVGIGRAQARSVIEGLFNPNGGRFLCHSSGTAENVERAVPCAGAQIFREKCADADPMVCILADRVPRPAGFDRSRLRG